METSELIHQLLINVGEDPEREGLRKTPERVAKSYDFLLSGYRINPDDVVGDAIFHEECNHMIIVRDIEVYSLCEHHMLPFYGRCHIGYIPRGQVFGVSKLARLVDCFARLGWKPSTSFSGRIAVSTLSSSMCFGSGSCTRMPSIFGSSFSFSINANSSDSG